jgi:hypothetical protein
MKKKIECFLIGICVCVFCNAQQAVSTAGGEAAGAGGTVSYTIGQVAYTTNSENEGTVSQGVQQPYEIIEISSNEDKYRISLELSVYPNPANEYLMLKVVNYKSSNLTYQLYDLNGKLLENKEIVGVETTIEMDMLAPSIYFLKVTDNIQELKIFKIIKN